MTVVARAMQTPLQLVEPQKLCWFVHLGFAPPTPLGFVRDTRGGALVIGGRTGSHCTGHGESWWEKLCEIASLGYIPVELALHRSLIPADWAAPELSDKDAYLVQRIHRGEI